ncbi:MAG: hypothetical protein QME60_00670 [Verrucomicrobiota bacterium]|nr:hypothetical protein [Verrucomicrobiota bacterium]
MKRVLTVGIAVVVCAAFLAVAQTNTVTSVNVVGYVKKTLLPGGKYHQVAPAFDGMQTNTIMGIFGTNTLRAGGSPLFCDAVLIWDAGVQSYVQVGLNSSDMQYHYLTNFVGSPIDPVLDPGDGAWVMSVRAGAGATQTNNFAMLGEAVASSNHQQVIVVGYQMLGVPFSSSMAITNLNFGASGATASGSPALCDYVIVWDENATQYKQYGLKTDGWREISPVNRWTETVPTGDEIPISQGFWFRARNVFTWSVNNPYLGSL